MARDRPPLAAAHWLLQRTEGSHTRARTSFATGETHNTFTHIIHTVSRSFSSQGCVSIAHTRSTAKPFDPLYPIVSESHTIITPVAHPSPRLHVTSAAAVAKPSSPVVQNTKGTGNTRSLTHVLG